MALSQTFDVIVIGGGPGGYVAAAHGARLGLTVACVEKADRLGGVCLNMGCIPSKALLDSSQAFVQAGTVFADHGVITGKTRLDLAAMMARKDQVVTDLTDNVRRLLERNKVALIHGTARLADATTVTVTGADTGRKTALTGKAVLLATGSAPIQVPNFPFDGKRIISSTEALALKAVPKRLGIVGGGYIGLELGSVWQRLGAQVTVVEMLPRIAAGLDGQVGRTLERLLKKQGLDIRTKTRVETATVSGGKVKATLAAGDKTETMSLDHLLVSVGRRPQTRDLGLEDLGVAVDEKTGQIRVDGRYQTSVAGVYAIGDLTAGPMLAHKASAEGMAAMDCIAGLPGEVNYDVIPSVVYTHPECAAVGITEEQAKNQGVEYRSAVFPFGGSGRARCLGETDGFVKILAARKTDRLLGVHIIGPQASELIATAAAAMSFQGSAEDLARTVHAHPTLSEAMMEAAQMLQ